MIEFGHSSHVGLRREHNEDTYYADADLGLWLVADGMGGHEHGEVASALARETRRSRNNPKARRWRKRCSAPTKKSSSTRARRPKRCRWVRPSPQSACRRATTRICWVGDSRVYLWNGELKQFSQDHSYVQELIQQGAITHEQARTHPHRNVVTQALGVTIREPARRDTAGHARAGMQILLCSDGLTEEVDDKDIAAVLARRGLSAQECVDHLILAALDGGGSDNVTVILIRNR